MNSLYVHVPFCESKCPYCAFASAAKRAGDEEKFLRSLREEISVRRERTGAFEELDTLYIGGGTPTALSPEAWRELVDILGAFDLAPDAEVTVEANPGSLSPEHLKVWSRWGVTRVSVGVQSFDDAELLFLGRVHSSSQAVEAVEICGFEGFDTSVDLIFGLPYSPLDTWTSTLRRAAELAVKHISIYQLTIEPGTPFAERNFELADGYKHYRYAQWYLPHTGLSQYEVASFSTSGHESRHNLNYWADSDYTGIGPAAWSYIGGTRSENATTLDDYSQRLRNMRDATVFEEYLDPEPAARQAAMLALRTIGGIDWRSFEKKHGVVLRDEIKNILGKFPEYLVRMDDSGASLTQKGLRVANSIWEEII